MKFTLLFPTLLLLSLTELALSGRLHGGPSGGPPTTTSTPPSKPTQPACIGNILCCQVFQPASDDPASSIISELGVVVDGGVDVGVQCSVLEIESTSDWLVCFFLLHLMTTHLVSLNL